MERPEQGPVIIYVRASDPGKQEKSCNDQEAAAVSWIAANPSYYHLHTFRDDLSGKSKGIDFKRPGLLAMLDFMEKSREKGLLLVHHRDRLSRPKHEGDASKLELKLMCELGWWIEPLSGTRLTGDRRMDKFSAFLEYSQAGMEGRYLPLSKVVGERMFQAASERKEWLGGRIPYGYALRISGNTGERIVPRRSQDADGEFVFTEYSKHKRETTILAPGDPQEVAVVKLIFDLYLRQGLGVEKIRKELRARGYPSPAGKTIWPVASIRNILVNPLYIGTYVWNKRTRATYCPIRDGKPVERPYEELGVAPTVLKANKQSDWVVHEDHHEPLIDKISFEKAWAQLSSRNMRRGRNHDYLLTGLDGVLKCVNCGYAMTGRKDSATTKAGKQTYFQYKCCNRDGTCFFFKVRCRGLDRAVKKMLVSLLTPVLAVKRETLRSRLVDRLMSQMPSVPGEDLADLRERADALKAKIEGGYENMALLKGDAAAGFARRLEEWNEELLALHARIKSGERATTPRETEALADSYLALLDDLPKTLDKAPLERQRRLVKSAVQQIGLRFDVQAKRGQRFQEGMVQLSPAMMGLVATVGRVQTGDPVRNRVGARHQEAPPR